MNDQPDEIRMREAGLASLNRAGLAIRLTCSVEPPRILNKEAQTNQISDDTLSHRTRRVLLAIIFGMALILRGGVVWQMGAMPVTDALEYHTIAVNQLAGLGHALEAGQPTRYRAPLYPLFLAGIYAVFGIDPKIALYGQAILHAALVFPIFFLAWRIIGSHMAGFVAAVVFALHPSFEIVSIHYTENLTIILVVLFLWYAFDMEQTQPGWWKAIAAGLFAGLLGLTHPSVSLLGVAVLLAGISLSAWRQNWKKYFLVATMSLVIVAPWQVRNQSLPDLGKDREINVVLFSYYPALVGSWWWPVTDMVELEKERAKAKAFLLSRDDWNVLWDDLGAAIAKHPFRLMELSFSRVLILWASPPVGSSTLGNIAPWLKWLALVCQYGFVGIGVGTLLVAVRHRRELLPFLVVAFYWTLVFGSLHALRRYGYPLVPVLAIFVSWSIWSMWQRGTLLRFSGTS